MSDSPRPKYLNHELPVAERVNDLVSRMTLEEKVSQMVDNARGIPRLDVPSYHWWNECLHGVGRAGRATVFPQAIGMAASFDTALMHKVASAISDEARAKHHAALRFGHSRQYFGLTYWTPNINIFRDPRWGRGQETYGECPFLTARMGVAFVNGLQGSDPKYLKLVATPKHYAVHSGPEPERHGFNAVVSPRDLRETYLPAFQACVREARAASVMGAYNRTNGEACCASPTLLQKILREEWGFDGYVVSDCGAIDDIHRHHQLTRRPDESAALAVRNGCDLNCGDTYPNLIAAVKAGLIAETEIDTAVKRLFTARFRLGLFDPPELVPYSRISPTVVNSREHRQIARQMARESIVLLKNANKTLPLKKDIRTLAVVGPTLSDSSVLLGNYHGHSPYMVTFLDGVLGAISPATQLHVAPGVNLDDGTYMETGGLKACLEASDAIVAFLGITPRMEGEEGCAEAEAGGDRIHIGLPERQDKLLAYLRTFGRPLVVVLTGGSPLAVNSAAEKADAVLMAWYPGEEGGHAVADVLFGAYNPSGRLPVTFCKSVEQLPPFRDYRMAGRTYRFMTEEPLYRFGYGLSYATFVYGNVKLSRPRIAPGDDVTVTATVRNTGTVAGDEVVQLYVTDIEASVPVPLRRLEGFQRVNLRAGQSKTVSFTLKPGNLVCYADDGQPFVEPGDFQIAVGGGQPNDPASHAVSVTLTVA